MKAVLKVLAIGFVLSSVLYLGANLVSVAQPVVAHAQGTDETTNTMTNNEEGTPINDETPAGGDIQQ